MSSLTRDYDYPLPEELIARYPLPQREASRMMVLHRAEQRIEHRVFSDFPSFMRQGDLVVLNNTRVIPARVFSRRWADRVAVSGGRPREHLEVSREAGPQDADGGHCDRAQT